MNREKKESICETGGYSAGEHLLHEDWLQFLLQVRVDLLVLVLGF
jgi:hypothetical protein